MDWTPVGYDASLSELECDRGLPMELELGLFKRDQGIGLYFCRVGFLVLAVATGLIVRIVY